MNFNFLNEPVDDSMEGFMKESMNKCLSKFNVMFSRRIFGEISEVISRVRALRKTFLKIKSRRNFRNRIIAEIGGILSLISTEITT